MAEPPSPKRPKLSEPDATRSQPATPTRASYQSPTKASLARSHPNLLARSPGRDRNSGAYSRGRNLRMSLLTNKTVHLDGDAGVPVPVLQSLKHGTNVTPVSGPASDGRDGFSAAIARAFTENRPRASTSTRSPLISRQPSASHRTQNDQRSPSPAKEATPSFMRPKLVPLPESSSSSTRHTSSEPDLPPTPVQLGLEPPAERPRGLVSSSSSPRGSKSNSGRKRRRHGSGLHATSSPSKLRVQVHRDAVESNEPLVSTALNALPEEAPESDVGEPDTRVQEDDIPESLKEKQTTHKSLQAELAQLKADLRRLETMAETETRNITPRTLKALTTTTNRSRSGSPDIVLPEMITMPTNPIPHLTLFMPAGLRVKTSTQTTKKGPNLLQIHKVIVNAPAPYPPHLLGATFEVRTNPQTTRITSVKVAKWHGITATQHAGVRKWVDTRLNNPLHSRDIGGLIWGLGSYWDFCVDRANVWKSLMTERPSDEEAKPEELVRWLAKDSIDMSVTDSISLLISWTAQLDWTGGVYSTVGFACKGVPEQTHGNLSETFERLRRRKGLVKAAENVIRTLREA